MFEGFSIVLEPRRVVRLAGMQVKNELINKLMNEQGDESFSMICV